ncbi:MAG: hypothetical protein ACJ8C4_16075 [Gemmataceae bacterium]
MTFARLCGGWALGALLLAPGTAPAAWDSVFQLTCCGHRSSNKCCAPACTSCAPPCATCPTTAYVQRSCYQPTTVYKPVTTYEPVTSYRTSYYYEPVQTMSYSLYVDPCTGCSSQVACPSTSYQLRSQCNACTSYVQRISYQPVTAYRQSFYYDTIQLQPSCPTCQTAQPSCATCQTAAAATVYAAPQIQQPQYQQPQMQMAPQIQEQSVPPQQQTPAPPLNVPQDNRSMPPQTTERSLLGNTSTPRPAPVRADRLASANSAVVGSVVAANWQPQGNAKLRFVRDDNAALPVSTDAAGRFNVTLASGHYRIYTEDGTGRTVYHSDLTLTGESRNVMVVNR